MLAGSRSHGVRLFASLIIVVMAAGACLAALSIDYQRGVVSADGATTAVLHVAVANEDSGTVFEDQPINLGQSYVRQLENDPSSVWHVVSRPVAESGLASGTYNLLVLIPDSFSSKVLDINSPSPEPVGVTYQVNANGNAQVEAASSQKGAQIVDQLGDQLVDMYVASILGNLHQAQQNVDALVALEADNTTTFSTELVPSTTELNQSLGVLTHSSGGSLMSNTTLAEGLGMVDSAVAGSLTEQDDHVRSFEELTAARELGTLSQADLLESLMAMDSTLLGSEVRKSYADLVRLGDSLTRDLEVSDVRTHTSRVAQMQADVDLLAAASVERTAVLEAFDLAAELPGYRSRIDALVDVDADGVVTFGELLTNLQGEQAEGPLSGVEAMEEAYRTYADDLTAAATRAITSLPYRNADELAAPGLEGALGHVDGLLPDLATQITDDLAVISTFDGYADIASDPATTVGADLEALVAALVEARAYEPPEPCVPEEEIPEPGTPEEPEPEECAPEVELPEPDLAQAAGLYGAELARISDVYDQTAQLVLLRQAYPSASSVLDIDMSASIDTMIAAVVPRRVEAEREHQVTVAALSVALQAASLTLGTSTSDLSERIVALDAEIDTQLVLLESFRDSMSETMLRGDALSGALARSDAATVASSGGASALMLSSRGLADVTRSALEQSQQTAEALGALNTDVELLIADSDGLDGQSKALLSAFQDQVLTSQSFSDTFSTVLASSHDAGVLNERLMDLLVSPVEANPREPVHSSDVTQPFPWILTIFVLCFVVAFGLTATSRSAAPTTFASDRGARRRRRLQDGIRATCVAAPLGVGIALLSIRTLDVQQDARLIWGACVVLICVQLTVLFHWLVKQWRALGVGVCLLWLVSYVFLTDAVGASMERSGISGLVSAVNPLTSAEQVVSSVLSADAGLSTVIALAGSLLVIALVSLVQRDDIARLIPSRLVSSPA